jgi:cobalt/nickel transport system ATP-binding protein
MEENSAFPGSRARESPPGCILVADAEKESGEEIRAGAARLGIRYIGAMGTPAKLLAQKAGITPDFTYGVIDKCLLRSVLGEQTLILTSGGMVARVFSRVEEFAREKGLHILVKMLKDA